MLEAQLAATPEAAGAAPEEIAAAARLAAGDLERARYLLSPTGRELRGEVETIIAATLADELSTAPWRRLLDDATKAGEEAEGAVAPVAACG